MTDGRLHRWIWGTPEGRMKFYAHPVRWASTFGVYIAVFTWMITWSHRSEVGFFVADLVGGGVGAAAVYTWMKWHQRPTSDAP